MSRATWTASLTPGPAESRARARAPAFWMAMAARAARFGASSTGSRPNAATISRGPSSWTRPPKLRAFSLSSSRDIAVRRAERVEQPLAFHARDSVVEAQCLLGGSRHRIRRGWLGDGSRGQCQARGGDHRSIRKQSRPLEDVAELADISGPAVTEQRRASVGSQRLARQAVVNADASQEMLGERGDVLRALAQRRQRDGQDSQAVIEILAEAPGVDGGGQLLAAGREDPDVDGLAPGAADRKSTRLNSSHRCISYAVFCLKKKTRTMPGPRRHLWHSRR